MSSYISGVTFRLGLRSRIEELFDRLGPPEPGIDFFLARGLRHYCRQVESTAVLCTAVIRDCLRKAAVAPESLGGVVIDANQWHCEAEDRIQMLESLHAAGITRVPVIGLDLQTCSGCPAAVDLADRLLRTDPDRKPILVMLCGRAVPGGSRIDLRRSTILSDGVSACIVSSTPGPFALLSSTTHMNLEMVRSGVVGEKAAISLVRSYREISAVATRLYESAEIQASQIESLFCTNGNLMYTAFAARAAGVDGSRSFDDNIPAYGHVFSCDHLINLATYAEAERFQQGKKYLIIGWSPYVFGGAVVRYEGDPRSLP